MSAVAQTVATFGGIDILVNNASAISLTGTLDTPMKRYDLMHQVNARGTFLCTQTCLPHLEARRESARADDLAAAQPGRALVRAARRVHDGQVRDEPVRAGHGRRVSRRTASRSTRCGRGRSSAPPRCRRFRRSASRSVMRTRTPEIVADAAHVILTRDRARPHRPLLPRRRGAALGRRHRSSQVPPRRRHRRRSPADLILYDRSLRSLRMSRPIVFRGFCCVALPGLRPVGDRSPKPRRLLAVGQGRPPRRTAR